MICRSGNDSESDVTVHTDGRTYIVPAGTVIWLTPGESIHVQQYLYHDFAVEKGAGSVLLGEVDRFMARLLYSKVRMLTFGAAWLIIREYADGHIECVEYR